MRTLVLDIGGVFYLGRPNGRYWARWAKETKRTPAALKAEFWHGPDIEQANVGLISAETYYARSAERMRVSPLIIEAMVRDAFVGDFNLSFATFVRALRNQGVAVSALTNSWSSEHALMARPELVGLFDQVISSCDVGMTKPDPAIYHRMMERLGLTASDIVFVDDTPANVDTARSLGMRAIVFRTTAQAIKTLSACFI